MSEKKRQEGGVIQCTEKDFQEKQAMFFTLLGDYISSANRVLFYCIGKFKIAFGQSDQYWQYEKTFGYFPEGNFK